MRIMDQFFKIERVEFGKPFQSRIVEGKKEVIEHVSLENLGFKVFVWRRLYVVSWVGGSLSVRYLAARLSVIA